MSLKTLAFRSIDLLAPVTPFSLTRNMIGNPLFLPFYHVVSDHDLPHIKHLYRVKSKRDFSADLEFFLKHYTPIGPDDLLEAVNKDLVLPPNAFLVTIDDGFTECEQVIAPLLKQKGLPAVFFLNTGFLNNADISYRNKASILHDRILKNPPSPGTKNEIHRILDSAKVAQSPLEQRLHQVSYQDRAILELIADALDTSFSEYLADKKPYMTDDQVRGLLKDGFHIGAHSVDHPLYSRLTLEDQFQQTRESMQETARRFDLNYRFFAHPFMDNGISADYFDTLVDNNEINLMFGTSGLMADPCPINFQRVFMERSADRNARAEINEEMLKTLARRLSDQNTVTRSKAVIDSDN